jgi:calcineurin-like phosphoesterase family protein
VQTAVPVGRRDDEAMIANWNAAVGPDDDVWRIGDFA